MSDARLDELLLRWEELAEAGRDPSAEELCRDCPELADELGRRITALKQLAWLSRLVRSSHEPEQGSAHLPGLAAGNSPAPGYALVRRIGRGGFGEVWEARGPNGPVALKFVPHTGLASSVEWRAVELIKGVRHPHLLSTLAAWHNDDILVIAMELADRTLFERWEQCHKGGLQGIPREELLGYFRQAADAIDFLHGIDIHHRDLKPQNLLLKGDAVKVADFGLARVLVHSVTGHTGSLTVAYAAPEFFDGKTARHSDQYSLAVAYCQLRGGRLPFEGTAAQVVAGHLHRSPDLTMLPGVERSAVARALSKRPEARWGSCQEFVGALSSGKAGRPRRRLLWLGVAIPVTLGLLLAMALWRPGAADPVSPFKLVARPQNVRALASSPLGAPFDRAGVFTNGTGGPILWDARGGTALREFPAEGGPCADLAPFGQPVGVTGHDDGRVILWDLNSATPLRELVGHRASVSCVAFSPDGQQVLSGGTDKTVRLWSRQTGGQLLKLQGHPSFVMSVAFDPTGTKAVSGGWDGEVRLWDLRTGKHVRTFAGHAAQVWSVAFSHDGHHVLSGSNDRTARLWEVETGQELRRFEAGLEVVHCARFIGGDLALLGGLPCVQLWDVKAGRVITESPRQSSPVQSLSILVVGGESRVFCGTAEHGVRVWTLPKGVLDRP